MAASDDFEAAFLNLLANYRPDDYPGAPERDEWKRVWATNPTRDEIQAALRMIMQDTSKRNLWISTSILARNFKIPVREHADWMRSNLDYFSTLDPQVSLLAWVLIQDNNPDDIPRIHAIADQIQNQNPERASLLRRTAIDIERTRQTLTEMKEMEKKYQEEKAPMPPIQDAKSSNIQIQQLRVLQVDQSTQVASLHIRLDEADGCWDYRRSF